MLSTWSQLEFHIYKILTDRNLKQGEIGALLGIMQPEVSHLMNGHFSRFTTDKLLDFLRRLDRKVTIRISAPAGRALSGNRRRPLTELWQACIWPGSAGCGSSSTLSAVLTVLVCRGRSRRMHHPPEEIRCRFVFSGKNDEPTPDFPHAGVIRYGRRAPRIGASISRAEASPGTGPEDSGVSRPHARG